MLIFQSSFKKNKIITQYIMRRFLKESRRIIHKFIKRVKHIYVMGLKKMATNGERNLEMLKK
jgi:hypothetical protein